MSAGNFGACFTFTVGAEGKYSDTPEDSGNWTGGAIGSGRLVGSCYGIAAPTLIDWLGAKNGHLVTAEYMRNLSLTTAKTIYNVRYWNALRAESLPLGVDIVVFDFGVNAGCHESAKELQTVVGASVDGVIGPLTIAATNHYWSTDIVLIESLISSHDRFYRYIGGEDLEGWLNRQAALKAAALDMVGSK